MNKTLGITIAVVVLVIAAGAAYVTMDRNTGMEMKADEPSNMEVTEMETNEAMGMDNAPMEEGEAGMMDDESAMMKPGSYEAYAPEKLARAAEGDVVLFFHAAWCPSCRGLNADIEKNLSAIPSGVSILKVDYDTETELKKKYGVTYQHTLVQVAADGTMIKKWSGSPSLERMVAQIN